MLFFVSLVVNLNLIMLLSYTKANENILRSENSDLILQLQKEQSEKMNYETLYNEVTKSSKLELEQLKAQLNSVNLLIIL